MHWSGLGNQLDREADAVAEEPPQDHAAGAKHVCRSHHLGCEAQGGEVLRLGEAQQGLLIGRARRLCDVANEDVHGQPVKSSNMPPEPQSGQTSQSSPPALSSPSKNSSSGPLWSQCGHSA
ncbi:hypothetical protein Aave_2392 [Paracidovorax citrulli AAC00-1]|uniref:Uncharacterized protein n=1 Tax=Paracidovorax citrulli (strain AAC00-1) TaxID=397945 RepID=A1TPS9_PARC0|nr:hypothetical protein Aave_2392 [Paracidovorax citrulli AAC00-1]